MHAGRVNDQILTIYYQYAFQTLSICFPDAGNRRKPLLSLPCNELFSQIPYVKRIKQESLALAPDRLPA
jgi:hypothetical protein